MPAAAVEDPSIVAELLLLLRLVLADGEAPPPAAALLRRIAADRVGIGAEGVEEVAQEIEHLVAAAGTGGAAAALRDMPLDRRRTLALRLAAIFAADEQCRGLQGRLAGRLAAILGLEQTPSPA